MKKAIGSAVYGATYTVQCTPALGHYSDGKINLVTGAQIVQNHYSDGKMDLDLVTGRRGSRGGFSLLFVAVYSFSLMTNIAARIGDRSHRGTVMKRFLD